MPSFTREKIMESCLKMLNERPMSQITVKAIVEDCGINRNSFYYHFTDIPTLLGTIVTEYADRLIAEYAKADSLEECLAAATQFARENRRAVLHVYRSENRGIYEQHLIRVCHDVVVSYLETAFGDVPVEKEDAEALVHFFQCELIGQILTWLESDMNYDIQSRFARMSKLRREMVEEIISRVQRDTETQNP
ncbi:MAG: TetR/AcrR family transcriptional regulator [Ruminococcaceae bacterium]|nr:TetR/AcrR family transcriptional regulator [Oscillospiraceae bacterium]